MSTAVIQKYKDVNPVNDEVTTHSMMQMLVDASKPMLASMFATSEKGGRFYMLKSEVFPGKVIEYVPGLTGSDSVTTLYTENRIFASRQALLDAREELITAIEYLLMAVPGTAVVRDNGRERECHLHELGTAQLLDTLIHFNQTSPTIVGA